MPEDISLLPENLRKKEEELKKTPPPPAKQENLRMYVPQDEADDVEVIEVDEGDVGDVLGGEPFVTRAIFQTQAFIQEMMAKLFHPHPTEPPPKLPPQFFKPPAAAEEKKPTPASGLVPISGGVIPAITPTTPPKKQVEAKPKARIMPVPQAPKRVRVIKRVRKPVRVSFLDEEAMRLQVDVPRRRFTLIILSVAFIILFAGTYALLVWQGDRAAANLQNVRQQLTDIQNREKDRQAQWASFQDLEPHLKALALVLGLHISPTKLFSAIEANTVPDVSYSSFTLTPDNHVSLAATAPSFESAARQVVAFRQSGIATTVEAMGYQATYDPKTGLLAKVDFQISLTLDPNVMKVTQPVAQATP